MAATSSSAASGVRNVSITSTPPSPTTNPALPDATPPALAIPAYIPSATLTRVKSSGALKEVWDLSLASSGMNSRMTKTLPIKKLKFFMFASLLVRQLHNTRWAFWARLVSLKRVTVVNERGVSTRIFKLNCERWNLRPHAIKLPGV